MQPPSPAQSGVVGLTWSMTCADRAAARHMLPSRSVRVAPLALQEKDRGDMGSGHHDAWHASINPGGVSRLGPNSPDTHVGTGSFASFCPIHQPLPVYSQTAERWSNVGFRR